MSRPEIVHHTSGTRTKSSDFRSIPSPRNFPEVSSPERSLQEKIRRGTIIVSVVLVVALTLWGALTYYNARRNSPSNVLAKSVERIYTIGYQNRAQAKIDKKKQSTRYTMDNMLIEANPFGTNTNSLYVYFVTEQPMSVSYTVNAPQTSYPSFSRTVSSTSQRGRTHEFQVIGLIPSTRNVITFTITDAAGKSQTREYTYDMGDLLGTEPLQVNISNLQNSGDTVPQSHIGDGLFAVMPQTDSRTNFIYLYDSQGILRSEIPLQNSTATRILHYRDEIVYSISSTQFAVVSKTGHVDNFISFDGRYTLASDYTMDSSGNIIAIATNGSTRDSTKEVGNYIIRINILNGKMRVLANLSTILNSYRSTTKKLSLNSNGTTSSQTWNWLGLNSIAMIDDSHVLLSSRETSSLLTLSIVDSPSITSVIGPASLWNDSKYSYLLMRKDGNFADAAGQSDIHISDVTTTGYTVSFFNSNFAYSPSNPTFNWSAALPLASQHFTTNPGEANSYVYTYHIDTANNTYSLTTFTQVDYSPINSTAQFIDGKLITTNSSTGQWTVWDDSGWGIAQYTPPTDASSPLIPLYRVQYDAFDRFYFASAE